MTAEEKKSVDRILFYIESDPSTGHIGMAEMLQIHSKEIQDIRDNQNTIQERNRVLYRVGVTIGGLVTFIVGKSWSSIVMFFKTIT